MKNNFVPISSLVRRDGSGGIVQTPIFLKSDHGLQPAMLLGKNGTGQVLVKTEESQGKPVPVEPTTPACRQNSHQ